MSLRIFNTLSGEKEDFVPLTPGEVRMYVCGVTVYDSSHIGHARSLLTFDTIYRYLKLSGYRVQFVRNFTDVDDKIINKANEQKSSCEAITDRYVDEFHQDAESLGLLAPSLEPRATLHIPEIIELIQKLEERQLAYRVDGDVFFSVPDFPGYGKLSRKRIDELEAGARVEIDERKKSPLDFALWKSSKSGEPKWESPWGPGRPGWHIECSAMSSKYLGQPFDIHGGGRDLMFPHHENEIAQSEGAFGLPLARYWMHNGLLTVNGEKMSKSLGNYFTIEEILQEHDPVAVRQLFLASHYRSPSDFSNEALHDAGRAADRIYETIERSGSYEINQQNRVADASLLAEFRQEMDDDFNTPRALALIFDEVRSLNRLLDAKQNEGIVERVAALETVCEALGLMQDGPQAFFSRKKARWLRQQGFSEHEVQKAIAARDQARMEKNWQKADRIRNELLTKGILVEDSRAGTTWKVR
ncbi:MAG TPA: cysteine--tRNA ligase [Candidatus Polarisedimenticolaceae bacterium]|nr:cysteine--tRNA ligase [Candidatus Polarisedimenticolaceae bacterium]